MIGIVMFFALVVVPIIIFWSEHREEARSLTRNQPAEIEPAEPVGWQCEQYSQRLLEEKFVEAGIMSLTEMTTCDDIKCKNCKPTHNAIHDEAYAKVRAERENRKREVARREAEREARIDRNLLRGSPKKDFLDYFKCEVCSGHVNDYDDCIVDDMGLTLMVTPKIHDQCKEPEMTYFERTPRPLPEPDE